MRHHIEPAAIPRVTRNQITGARWRPGLLSILILVLVLSGSVVLLYPAAASWVTSYNQSLLIERFSTLVDNANPDPSKQLESAREYNDALTAGVDLLANAHVPESTGSLDGDGFDYRHILSANPDGLMARVKIRDIDVDLPVYHGTSDETLLMGAGHLEGSHLPIGGESTHSVITAHRGLANATMFSNLDRVKEGDTFTIETFGKVLSYRVVTTKVVQPDDTDSLRAESGRDLVTLVTCTPLGINSHRILVTGERVTPTPEREILAAGARPEIPGFPWWAIGMGAAVVLGGAFLWRAGFSDAKAQSAVRRKQYLQQMRRAA